MILRIVISNPVSAKEVLALQIPSYTVEAKLIDCYDIPALKDSVETLQKCGETFFGYYEKEMLVGALSLKIQEGVIDIHRLIVHPDHFRKGIAKQLMNFVEAEIEDVHTIIVSTGSKNEPAVRFYLNNGFRNIGELQITETLFITKFMKNVGSLHH
ncbi:MULTISPECIES: N-acetyltransferase [unclassified Bacillus (in: firmicutes)]|uniref:GNAT family N-acetyltransferase n=1 Tax=unclassified Bacillus (in: firmicutes) TaxID=185979 RepID=UPI0008F30E56|nr:MULTISPECIES: GNAT family N-acetyltransferase [unclassified Bacillus (in: firmicutes)]SFA87163.1 Acetyltransferase (GNAT) family protein [Bacillus sp. UNCCL13]SFQ84106.1 Acetyltransferase (GNAT) family protein [Bacillus sp. cl95]